MYQSHCSAAHTQLLLALFQDCAQKHLTDNDDEDPTDGPTVSFHVSVTAESICCELLHSNNCTIFSLCQKNVPQCTVPVFFLLFASLLCADAKHATVFRL